MTPAYSPTFIDHHQHGPTWWQVILIALATIAAYDAGRWALDELHDLAVDARARVRRRREERRERLATLPVEGAADLADEEPTLGTGTVVQPWTPDMNRALAEQQETMRRAYEGSRT